jgi:hypothetical protein
VGSMKRLSKFVLSQLMKIRVLVEDSRLRRVG